MSDLSNPIFHDETKAREWLEARIWPHGPVCLHCGTVGEATLMKGKTTRPGLYQCNACREPFTVTMGTLYERSHIPLNKWLLATHLMMASKKGISSLQLHRMLGISKKSAWFMAHRIRESLRETKLPGGPLGGYNQVVEVDETYVGGKAANRKNHIPPKEAVVALVERGGRVRSHHVPAVNGTTLKPILAEQIDKRTHVLTDDSTVYPPITTQFAGHSTVNHSIQEYVRGGGFYHTNTVENYFSPPRRNLWVV
jgi:transposase-like protein